MNPPNYSGAGSASGGMGGYGVRLSAFAYYPGSFPNAIGESAGGGDGNGGSQFLAAVRFASNVNTGLSLLSMGTTIFAPPIGAAGVMATGVFGAGLSFTEAYITKDSAMAGLAMGQLACGTIAGKLVVKYGGTMARSLTTHSTFSLNNQTKMINVAIGGYIDAVGKVIENTIK